MTKQKELKMGVGDYNCLGGCETCRQDYSLICNCCSSCHSEEEDGYFELLELLINDKQYYSVCCEVKMAYNEKYLKKQENNND